MPDEPTRLHRLEQALATMQVGVTISDAEGRILYVNLTEARMHGYSPEELIGRPTSIFAPDAPDQPKGPPRLDRVQSWKRETTNVRRDGSTFPVELLSDVVTDREGRPVGLVTISQDITERKEHERALEKSEERYVLAVRGSKDGIWDWDVARGTLFCSPRWNEMLGLEGTWGQVPIRTLEDWIERIHPADREELRADVDRHVRGETHHLESTHRLRREDGSYLWALARGAAVRDDQGSAVRIAGSLSDITAQRARDPLTGLPNRLLLEDRLGHALERCRRRPETRVGVLFLDLDRFKVVNDSLGHLVGDDLLALAAERLDSAVRSGETLARLGGDEFVAVLEEIESVDEARAAAKRFHRILEPPFELAGHELFLSASIGITLGEGEGSSAPDLLREADTAMYRAKLAGRAQTRVFDDTMRELAREQLELGNELRGALQREELELDYQPIVRAAGGEVVGLEALLRWRHRDRGLLHPRAFLRLAEEIGTIVPIGKYVLRRACEQMVRWYEQLDPDRRLTMSVNVSPVELARPDFVSEVLTVLEETGLPPSRLWLEITEEVLIDDAGQTKETLKRLRSHGIGIAIDDFGTGYSSLSYLDKLAVDTLKIDRSFVADMERVATRRELIESILQLAERLKIDVVAEGVETESQVQQLTSLRCSLLQGFALGEPRNAEETSSFLERAVGDR